MYMNTAKNPLRTFLGLNREKNKNIKAWPKKESNFKKSVCFLAGYTVIQSPVQILL